MSSKDAKMEYVEFTHPGGCLVAKIITPSVGQNEAPLIREQVLAEFSKATRGRYFILDLSHVSLVTSLGLGMCVDLRNCAEKAGLKPAVFGLNRHLLDLFRLMRIERLFTILSTRQEFDSAIGK